VPRTLVTAGTIALPGLIFAGWLIVRAGCSAGPPHATVIDPPLSVENFALTSHTREHVELSDYQGRWVLLFFGFTACPDFCPTTLSELARSLEQLQDAASAVQVLFVSVDTERDSPAKLAEYVAFFHPSFVGLFGSTSEIAAAEHSVAAYHHSHTKPSEEPTIEHTTRVYLLDPAGRMVASYPYGFQAEELTADLRWFLKNAPAVQLEVTVRR